MEVTIISETIQEFRGERFYLCGFYFQRKGKRLHRAVWEYHYGKIPDGFDIHYKDGNRANNDISNLDCLPREEHHRYHANTPAFLRYAKQHIEDIRERSVQWHGSDAGKQWHSVQGKENWSKRVPQTYTCTYCGSEFCTKHIYSSKSNRFCSNKCKAVFGRKVRAKKHEGSGDKTSGTC